MIVVVVDDGRRRSRSNGGVDHAVLLLLLIGCLYPNGRRVPRDGRMADRTSLSLADHSGTGRDDRLADWAYLGLDERG